MDLDMQKIIDEGYTPEFKKQKTYIRVTKNELDKIKKQEDQEKKQKERGIKSKDLIKENKKKVIKTSKKNKRKKLKNKFLKIKKLKDYNSIKDFLVESAITGVLINFSLFCIFKIPFTFYSWLGWGVMFCFIERRGINLIRGLWIK